MKNLTVLDIVNSFYTFIILFAIAVSVMYIAFRKDLTKGKSKF